MDDGDEKRIQMTLGFEPEPEPDPEPEPLPEPEPMSAPEVLLEVGADGGSLSLLRRRERGGHHSYAVALNQALFDDMEPETAPHSRSWPARDLRDAVLELGRQCRFTDLVPVRVHPDVVPVLRALRELERAVAPSRRERQGAWWDEVFAKGEYDWR